MRIWTDPSAAPTFLTCWEIAKARLGDVYNKGEAVYRDVVKEDALTVGLVLVKQLLRMRNSVKQCGMVLFFRSMRLGTLLVIASCASPKR